MDILPTSLQNITEKELMQLLDQFKTRLLGLEQEVDDLLRTGHAQWKLLFNVLQLQSDVRLLKSLAGDSKLLRYIDERSQALFTRYLQSKDVARLNTLRGSIKAR